MLGIVSLVYQLSTVTSLYIDPPKCYTSSLPIVDSMFEWQCSESQELGKSCRLDCSGEDTPNEVIKTTCTPEGWMPKPEVGTSFGCVPNICPDIQKQVLPFGSWNCSEPEADCQDTKRGKVCQLTCEEGYIATKGSHTVCTSEGWIPTVPSLVCFKCTPPPALENGEWICGNQENASSCILQCSPGFRSEKPGAINCIDGEYDSDPTLFNCVPTAGREEFEPEEFESGVSPEAATCKTLHQPEHGEWYCRKDGECSLACDDSFDTSLPVKLSCKRGNWCSSTVGIACQKSLSPTEVDKANKRLQDSGLPIEDCDDEQEESPANQNTTPQLLDETKELLDDFLGNKGIMEIEVKDEKILDKIVGQNDELTTTFPPLIQDIPSGSTNESNINTSIPEVEDISQNTTPVFTTNQPEIGVIQFNPNGTLNSEALLQNGTVLAPNGSANPGDFNMQHITYQVNETALENEGNNPNLYQVTKVKWLKNKADGKLVNKTEIIYVNKTDLPNYTNKTFPETDESTLEQTESVVESIKNETQEGLSTVEIGQEYQMEDVEDSTKNTTAKDCAVNSIFANGKCHCKPGFGGNGDFCGVDSDLDTIPDESLECSETVCKKDNCKLVMNLKQTDTDGDGIGNECDDDQDNDGIKFMLETVLAACTKEDLEKISMDKGACEKNPSCYNFKEESLQIILDDNKCKYNNERPDNCPDTKNPDQLDTDGDLVGDLCDNCPQDYNPFQHDTDNDGIGNACVDDADGDGIVDTEDNCIQLANPDQIDEDNDNVGDACDNCIKVSNPDQVDENQNNVGDACETGEDKDGDGIIMNDNCPDVANYNQLDSDDDGLGDACDTDIDNDGVLNVDDNCLRVPNHDQKAATPESVKGEACILDRDGDGVPDIDDACPDNKMISSIGFFKESMKKIDLCAVAENAGGAVKKQCNKEEPSWEDRNNGTELFQAINSRPAIAVNRDYSFIDVEYNGTIYVQDETDNDWVGFVFGYKDMFNFYIVAANMHTKESAMWWHVKKIQINSKSDDPNKYGSLIKYLAIMKHQEPDSTILWEDPKKQQWARKVPIEWNVKFLPSKGIIQFRMFEEGREIINSGDIQDPNPILGGMIGLYVRSQEEVLFSGLSFACLDSNEMELREESQTDLEKGHDYSVYDNDYYDNASQEIVDESEAYYQGNLNGVDWGMEEKHDKKLKEKKEEEGKKSTKDAGKKEKDDENVDDNADSDTNNEDEAGVDYANSVETDYAISAETEEETYIKTYENELKDEDSDKKASKKTKKKNMKSKKKLDKETEHSKFNEVLIENEEVREKKT